MGQPEDGHGGTVRATPLPAGLAPVVDLAGTAGPGTCWLLLTEDGRLTRWESDTGTHRVLATSSVAVPADAEPWDGHVPRLHLHASADGRFAAVVVDHGSAGEVFDLATGARTMVLDGGAYLPGTVPFALAFAEHEGRTVLVHRTDWNRLDAADPATGRSLTVRTTGPDAEGRPAAHDLDYFHGALHVSPGGDRIADDGWIWHPVGSCEIWSLPAWLGGNPYESEDGPTRVSTGCTDHHWNRPMAWLDDRLLAVGGLGDDDRAMTPGARIHDAARRGPDGLTTEVLAFAGPDGAFFAHAGLLYSAGPGGLEIWNPADGARLGTVPGFRPTHLHRAAGEFARVEGDRLLRWRPGPPDGA
ncbi:hypothetical protein KNE206_47520 [Kitasatospora sp. NE20-6]|uniref:hypothetical protein n=1 Tax=Kitasatospora sp. NE20-6 TaxID=2859066 RepID=UPI0034DBE23D